MNIVQQLLNSNIQTGQASSRFEFTSRSLSFSSSQGSSSTDFGQKLRQKLSSSSREIEFQSGKDDTSIRQQNDFSGGSEDSNFLKNLREQTDANGTGSGKEDSFTEKLKADRQLSSDQNEKMTITRQDGEEFRVKRKEDSSEATELGNKAEEEQTFLRSEGHSEADFTEKQKKLLKRIENGEVDLSREEDLKKVKELVESVSKEETSSAKKAQVMEALQGFFSDSSKMAERFQGLNAEELKKSIEGLQDLLKSFKEFAEKSREDLQKSLGTQVKSLLEGLNLNGLSGGDGKNEGESGKSSGEESGVKIALEKLGKSLDSLNDTSSDSEDSSPTKKLVKTLDEVIKKLEKLSQQLNGEGNSSSSLSADKIAEKVQSFLKDIKQSLEGSGSKKSTAGDSKSFFDRQVQQIMDELDQKIQDEDLRKKIKSELKKLQGDSESEKNSKSSQQSTKTKSNEKSSSDSNSENKKKSSTSENKTKENPKTSDSKDSNKSFREEESSKGDKSSNKNQGHEESQSKTKTGTNSENESKNESKPSKQTTSESKEAKKQSENKKSKAKKVGKESQSSESTESNSSQNNNEETSEKSSKAKTSDTDSESQKNSKSKETLSSGESRNDSKSTKESKPATKAVENQTEKENNGSGKNTSSDGKKSGKNIQSNQTKTGDGKVKTKAVENQPDKQHTFKKSDSSNSEKKTKTTQPKQQSFKASEDKAQKASQSKDVILETNNKKSKTDDIKTKAVSNSKNEKLASFETNTARAVDANEQSGTSFSNGNGSNQNSQTNVNMKSTVPSYSQRSPEAQKMINQIVEKAQTMLENDKQSMRMQLQPESLGEVKMEVSIEANQVSARFKVENSSVKQTLNSSMEQLKQSIQQMGLDVDNVDVSDMSADDGGNEESWFDDSSDENGRGLGGPGEADEAEEGIPEETQHRRRLREYSTIELVA